MRYLTAHCARPFRAIGAVAVSEPCVRRRNPSDLADDGTAGEGTTYPRDYPRSLSKNEQCGELEGSIALIGTGYNLILKAVNCASGDLLASTEAQASDKKHVLDALGRAASEMRRRLGESLSTVQKYNTPLEQATTRSLEALQAYSWVLKRWTQAIGAAALPFFQRATELDPISHGLLALANSTADNHVDS